MTHLFEYPKVIKEIVGDGLSIDNILRHIFGRCSCKYRTEAKNVNLLFHKMHNNRLNFIINAALYLWHTVAIFEEHGDSKLHSHGTHRISRQIKMGKEH